MSDLAINTEMSPVEKAQLAKTVADYNKSINDGRVSKTSMGKDDFLQLLMAQLQNQNPMEPMDNTAFIGQMAQFSSLEQMTNMNTSMTGLAASFDKIGGMIASSEAVGLLGQNVVIDDGANGVLGRVDQVIRGANPMVFVNGQYYDYAQVTGIAK